MKPILYMLCGCPGCGKTTYAIHFEQSFNARYVSRDEIRFSVLKNDEDYFAHEEEVFIKFYTEIFYDLNEGHNVIADATHLNKYSRNKLLRKLDSLDFDLIYIYFTTSFEKCCARNASREGRARVPDDAMENMWKWFQPPTFDENERCIGIMKVRPKNE